MSGKKYIIIGDSHVYPLAAAAKDIVWSKRKNHFNLYQTISLSAATDFYKDFYTVKNGKIFFSQEKMNERLISVLDESGCITASPDITWLISLGTHTSTFLSGPRWKTHRHWHTAQDSNKQPISDDVFKEMVLHMSRHILALLKDMTELGYDVSIISSPPPTKRFRIFEEGYSDQDVLFLDTKFRSIILSEINDIGLEFIEFPEHTRKDGFLKDEYLFENKEDVHHGNKNYSSLMLKVIANKYGKII